MMIYLFFDYCFSSFPHVSNVSITWVDKKKELRVRSFVRFVRIAHTHIDKEPHILNDDDDDEQRNDNNKGYRGCN